MINVGMIGMSPENGHPLSFSAIVNGYCKSKFKKTGWNVILNYLEKKNKKLYGFKNIKISHIWTQDQKVSKKISEACFIKNVVTEPNDLIGKVDAVIIARDDWRSHYKLSKPFLKAGIPTFIDKPLTLDLKEIEFFKPFLKSKKLMSTSGMRYSKEILNFKKKKIKNIRTINAFVVNDIEKYGVHILDAISTLGFNKPISATRLDSPFDSFMLKYPKDTILNLNCIGGLEKVFSLHFHSKKDYYLNLDDNFMAFRNTLNNFFKMIKGKSIILKPNLIIESMCVIKALANLKKKQSVLINYKI